MEHNISKCLHLHSLMKNVFGKPQQKLAASFYNATFYHIINLNYNLKYFCIGLINRAHSRMNIIKWIRLRFKTNNIYKWH